MTTPKEKIKTITARPGNEVLAQDELPDAPFYVTALDTFLSGWGHASSKENYVILMCDSEEEAAVVSANAHGRSEMQKVCIHTDKPALAGAGGARLYTLLTKDRSSNWYEPETWGGE
tara:strand:+ start:554 stop:904 length:351 start_codon:yes stop_codon:yes gene_type:complete